MGMEIAVDVVFDPLLVDMKKFSVQRRTETVGTNGRSTLAVQTFNNLVGVIDMFSDRELIRDRFPEMQYATNVITVICRFALQTEVTGDQPDIVVWRGDNYVVKKVSPYPQFGAGFYQGVCASVDATDVPP
jgi:hypothetical protein